MQRIPRPLFSIAIVIAAASIAGCSADRVSSISQVTGSAASRGGVDDGHSDGEDQQEVGDRGDLSNRVQRELAAVRRLTARYHDLQAATAAGYTVWSPDPFAPNATCPSSSLGNMGYHLVNVALRGGGANPAAGDAVIDPRKPEMLLYEKRLDGTMKLAGVEYIVFTAAWEREHGIGAPPPTVFGQPLLASSHTFPGNPAPIPHYELHVWLWRHNPLGIFAPWNPKVRC